MKDSGSQWVAYKNLLLTGTGTAAVPVTPPLPTPEPPAVAPGILTRFRDLVRRIKAAPAYTEAIGEALGIIGPDSIDEDPATLSERSCGQCQRTRTLVGLFVAPFPPRIGPNRKKPMQSCRQC